MPSKKPAVKFTEHLCAFCQQEEDHPFLGTLLSNLGIKAHSNCIFAASGLSQEKDDGRTDGEYIEGFHISAIQKEIRRGRHLGCFHCHQPGATVGCVIGSCPRSFHLPCITKAGGITLFEDPFPSYCKRHTPRQDLKQWFQLTDEAPTCCICLFSILPEDSPCKPTPSLSRQSKTSVASASFTPVSFTTQSGRRPPRRSCVTVCTPKCIQVSTGMTSVKRQLSLSNGSSTWELPDSPPEPAEPTRRTCSQTPCRKVSMPTIPNFPAWLLEYLDNVPEASRALAYETWQHNTVHGLCCPKAWMHRSCIAGFAVTAALHYVKCPYCADKQTFIRSIIAAGIWVPDRDAAWELEPGAYADLDPVEEDEENSQASSSSDTGIKANEGSSERSPRPEPVSGDTNKPNDPEPHSDQRDNNGLTPERRSSSHISGPPKPILSLVWTTQPVEPSQPTRRAKSRRFTHQSTFDHPKSPPPSMSRRGRRRLSVYPRSNMLLDTHVESRLRQATLGTFLASFGVPTHPQ